MSQETDQKERDDAVAASLRASLYGYAWHVSGGKWLPYPWLQYVAKIISRLVAQGHKRIIVSAPPRHGKSELCSHWLPTWYLDTWPHKKVINVGYESNIAAAWGEKVRDEFETNELTHAHVRQNHRAANDWLTTEGGGMMTAGIGGPLTSKGGDLIVVDDPHKNWAEAQSPVLRKKVINWFKSTLQTRGEPGATIIVVQTRWHERDLAGWLLAEHDDDWVEIRLPALAEKNDPLGREEGEALCPERYTREDLLRIKGGKGGGGGIGSAMFNCLFQQLASSPEGAIIQRTWLRYWVDEVHRHLANDKTVKVIPKDFEAVLQSWDLNYIEDGSSYVVGQRWGRVGSNCYLVDQVRDKPGFVDSCSMLESFCAKYPDGEKLIEAAANGFAIHNSMKDKLNGLILNFPTMPGSKQKLNKDQRLYLCAGQFEAGNVWLPHQSVRSWSSDCEEEIVTHPKAANDDQVDTTTQALLKWQKGGFVFL